MPDKTERVYNFHHATLHALAELTRRRRPRTSQPVAADPYLAAHLDRARSLTFANLYPALRPGELLDGTDDPRFRDAWAMARADSFQPAG